MASLALVYDYLRWESKAIVEAAGRAGVKLDLVNVTRGPLAVGGVGGWDVVLDRCVGMHNAIVAAEVMESMGSLVVNSSETLRLAASKVATLSLLARRGVPVPRTRVAVGVEAALKAAGELGYPVVVKPVEGSWGRGVALARDEEELRALLEYKEALPGGYSRVHVIQEYVEKPGRDIRVFTLGDRVVAGIYRVSEHWITNTSRGARAEPLRPDGELEDLALRASEALGGGFLGVDVFEDRERGYVVNEVNGVPEFRNTVRVTGVDIPGLLVEYALGLARR